MCTTKGYLQFGKGTTVEVPIKNTFGDNWFALYEGRWRKVHIQLNRLYVTYLGTRVSILIQGV